MRIQTRIVLLQMWYIRRWGIFLDSPDALCRHERKESNAPAASAVAHHAQKSMDPNGPACVIFRSFSTLTFSSTCYDGNAIPRWNLEESVQLYHLSACPCRARCLITSPLIRRHRCAEVLCWSMSVLRHSGDMNLSLFHANNKKTNATK
jgi:hypothetical protein